MVIHNNGARIGGFSLLLLVAKDNAFQTNGHKAKEGLRNKTSRNLLIISKRTLTQSRRGSTHVTSAVTLGTMHENERIASQDRQHNQLNKSQTWWQV